MGQNKEHRPYNSLIYTPICGGRGILYHSAAFCNSLIFKWRFPEFAHLFQNLAQIWRKT